jgi:hypothetical protein
MRDAPYSGSNVRISDWLSYLYSDCLQALGPLLKVEHDVQVILDGAVVALEETAGHRVRLPGALAHDVVAAALLVAVAEPERPEAEEGAAGASGELGGVPRLFLGG